MFVPQVAIVGRPNVGKSSLLNWLSGKLISVVDPTAGVTRDRVSFLMHEKDRYFELVDTGGIGIVDSDDLSADIERQINTGIKEAELILFVVDGKAGPTPLDIDVSRRLRGINKPVLIVVNKCDSPKFDLEIGEFYKLANAEIICTSVLGERNREDLLQAILDHLPKRTKDETHEGAARKAIPELKLAIVGRRNVGKSTFINALAETERMIVSEIAGTTRDSVDVHFELDGKRFIAIDTPGIRKKKSLANNIEFYSLVRSQRSIRRAGVVLMVFDAAQKISKVDKQLVHYIATHYKPCIFVVNKWDLAHARYLVPGDWGDYLTRTFSFMKHVPVAAITAKENKNTKQLINLCQSVSKQARTRVPTARLNAVIRAAILRNQPSNATGKRIKIFYGTQVAIEPPTIVLKCNIPEQIEKHWLRYLLAQIRAAGFFEEVPIKLLLRGRTQTATSVQAPGLDEIADVSQIFSEDDDLGPREGEIDVEALDLEEGQDVVVPGVLVDPEG